MFQRYFIFAFFFACNVFVVHSAFALQPGNLDPSFFTGTPGGANASVLAVVMQSDGKILIGGQFTQYGVTVANRIARLNADGTLDTSFNVGAGANGIINAIALQPDGKVLIGGSFTSYSGVATNRIARLNADGTHDATFSVGTGTNNTVNAIALQPDGKVLIGGNFSSYNGTMVNRIARLNGNGTVDMTFATGAGTGTNDNVNAVAVQSDGRIVIGGAFTTCNGVSASRIARLNDNGTSDATFTVGAGADNLIRAVTFQSDGKILIGGDFTAYNGTNINRIARLNDNGVLDTTFTAGTGADASVYTISIQPNQRILIGGSFIAYNGVKAFRIARLNADGTRDTTLNADMIGGAVYATALQSDERIVLGGSFNSISADSFGLRAVTRLNPDGASDTSFFNGTGLNSWSPSSPMGK